MTDLVAGTPTISNPAGSSTRLIRYCIGAVGSMLASCILPTPASVFELTREGRRRAPRCNTGSCPSLLVGNLHSVPGLR